MASLTNTKISDTYPLLLKIETNGIDGTLRSIEDGDGTASALQISTGAINVSGTITASGNVDFNGDLDVDGTTNLDDTDIDGTLTVDGARSGDFLTKLTSTNQYGLYIKTTGTTSSHDLLKLDDNSGTVFKVMATGATTVSGTLTAGAITAATGSKITSSSADTTFSIETTSGTSIFPVLDFVSSHSSVGGKIRQDGSDVITIDNDQDVTFADDVTVSGVGYFGTTASYIKQSNFGYSSSYKVLQLGLATSTSAISLGADLTGNSNGGFTGNEIVIPNARGILAPNGANNAYLGVLGVTSNDTIEIGRGNHSIVTQGNGAISISTSNDNVTFSGGTTTFPVGGILRFGERGNLTHNSSNYNMTFNTNSLADSLVITGSGDVGIGTASPDRAVTIYRSGGIGARLDFQTNDTGTGDGNGTEIGVYQNNMNAFIWNYENSDIYFGTNNAERMRIDSDGNVGIGETNPTRKLVISETESEACAVLYNSRNPSSSPPYILDLKFGYTPDNTTSYFIKGEDNGTGTPATEFHIYSDGSFVQTSDIRKKENIVDSENQLDKINQLKVRDYNKINDSSKKKHIGFIAQELQEVFPHLVIEAEDEMKSLQIYKIGIVPLLVKAVQELSAKVEALENA